MLSRGFFFIMDRLYDMLDSRMKKWKERLNPKDKSRRLSKLLCCRDQEVMTRFQQVERDVMMERELVVYDLASAYSYLHENR